MINDVPVVKVANSEVAHSTALSRWILYRKSIGDRQTRLGDAIGDSAAMTCADYRGEKRSATTRLPPLRKSLKHNNCSLHRITDISYHQCRFFFLFFFFFCRLQLRPNEQLGETIALSSSLQCAIVAISPHKRLHEINKK